MLESDRGPAAPEQRPPLINARRDGDSVTIALSGALDLASADQLDATIRDAERTDVPRIVVDLSGVSFIDWSGLTALLRAIRRNGQLHCIPSTGTIEWLD